MNSTKQVFSCIEDQLIKEGKEEYLYFFKLSKDWHIAVGEALAKKSSPLMIKNRTLLIGVLDQAYAQAMTMKKKDILSYIKVLLGSKKIQDIEFRVVDKLVETQLI